MRSPLYTNIIAATLLLFAGRAFCQLETPQPSPKGKVEQKVGVMDVSVSYSRPGIKGRKIFGDLVPYGQVWRTGANEPTTISFSDAVKLEGLDVPAGTYSLYTIPGEKEWTIIINKKTKGDAQRDEKEDAATFKVKPAQPPSAVVATASRRPLPSQPQTLARLSPGPPKETHFKPSYHMAAALPNTHVWVGRRLNEGPH